MPSPFPGMDPFLEDDKFWPTFHLHLISCLHQLLMPSLSDRFSAKVGQRHYVSQQVMFTSILHEEHNEPYLEIRERADARLVTYLTLVSPANKNLALGRQLYLNKRQEARAQNANLVEIDLVLQGQPLHDFSREGLPDWDFAVTITRHHRPDKFEIYTSTLQRRLQRFRLPLVGDDAVIDLQIAFHQAYELGNFGQMIDYRKEPATRLSEGQKLFAQERLKGLRVEK